MNNITSLEISGTQCPSSAFPTILGCSERNLKQLKLVDVEICRTFGVFPSGVFIGIFNDLGSLVEAALDIKISLIRVRQQHWTGDVNVGTEEMSEFPPYLAWEVGRAWLFNRIGHLKLAHPYYLDSSADLSQRQGCKLLGKIVRCVEEGENEDRFGHWIHRYHMSLWRWVTGKKDKEWAENDPDEGRTFATTCHVSPPVVNGELLEEAFLYELEDS